MSIEYMALQDLRDEVRRLRDRLACDQPSYDDCRRQVNAMYEERRVRENEHMEMARARQVREARMSMFNKLADALAVDGCGLTWSDLLDVVRQLRGERKWLEAPPEAAHGPHRADDEEV